MRSDDTAGADNDTVSLSHGPGRAIPGGAIGPLHHRTPQGAGGRDQPDCVTRGTDVGPARPHSALDRLPSRRCGEADSAEVMPTPGVWHADLTTGSEHDRQWRARERALYLVEQRTPN